MNFKKSLRYAKANGYVFPLAASLIAMTSIAMLMALDIASTQIHHLGAERQWLNQFHQSELKLIETESRLLQGASIQGDNLLQIEKFKPKYFRSRAGIETVHYKIQLTNPKNNLRIQSVIRIDETQAPKQSNKKRGSVPQRLMQRTHWELMHD